VRRTVPGSAPISSELALGMDATLEGVEREITQARAILASAVEGLMREFGERAVTHGVVALQFQDLADQLLASARRRIEMVREAIGNQVRAPAGAKAVPAPLSCGDIEFFQEAP
jgi:hypothetical protein